MNKIAQDIIQQVGTILLGKEQQVKLSLACLLARGHLLIEDLPGMGKTTLAQCLAKTLGLSYERVQFTSDLLPADILGASIFDANTNSFTFHSGPIFCQVLLADEINRTTPKTQSALLEAMEERQVSIDGKTRELPNPFFVIATQNPFSQAGTYPLPESQLDRFLMRISLGYPSNASERMLYQGLDPREKLSSVQPVTDLQTLEAMQKEVKDIQATSQLLDYLQRLVDTTRFDENFTYGLSPRGAMGLLNAAKAWAFIEGRSHLVPDDIQVVLPAVVGHRVHGLNSGVEASAALKSDNEHSYLVKYLLQQVDVLDR
ncbi:MoxR family ATPase [Teredinibacter sp. KSP-S5-2]|uniref:AAA family ATPase n=1 Tax=Teredinibacter sp. KSP-S5-2 TaxID=3034506 RepID=UPI0029342549|nr:MoxR family ATPase [Teredinibacter sp. KSP-S5-2]WNO10993.1 MoxR family ATPase [Teredinibacter sp. KSP-S5-2]